MPGQERPVDPAGERQGQRRGPGLGGNGPDRGDRPDDGGRQRRQDQARGERRARPADDDDRQPDQEQRRPAAGEERQRGPESRGPVGAPAQQPVDGGERRHAEDHVQARAAGAIDHRQAAEPADSGPDTRRGSRTNGTGPATRSHPPRMAARAAGQRTTAEFARLPEPSRAVTRLGSDLARPEVGGPVAEDLPQRPGRPAGRQAQAGIRRAQIEAVGPEDDESQRHRREREPEAGPAGEDAQRLRRRGPRASSGYAAGEPARPRPGQCTFAASLRGPSAGRLRSTTISDRSSVSTVLSSPSRRCSPGPGRSDRSAAAAPPPRPPGSIRHARNGRRPPRRRSGTSPGHSGPGRAGGRDRRGSSRSRGIAIPRPGRRRASAGSRSPRQAGRPAAFDLHLFARPLQVDDCLDVVSLDRIRELARARAGRCGRGCPT